MTTSAERRQIGLAIREFDHGRGEAMRALLCRLAKEFAPEWPTLAPALQPANETKTPGRAQPKPNPRTIDGNLLDRYRLLPCALRGADCWWNITNDTRYHLSDPHHLIRRSAGGGDCDENLIPLCRGHHTGTLGWHTLRPWPWWKRFSTRLSPEDYAKIIRAMQWDTVDA